MLVQTEIDLYNACKKLQEKINKLKYFSATAMSNLPSAHIAGGIVLNILSEDAAYSEFSNSLYLYERENIRDYEI